MRLVATLAATLAVAAISATSGQTVQAEAQQTVETTPVSAVMVTIERGDSLSKIASAHNSTYQRIFYANTEVKDPDVIFPGNKLRIPAADEVLEERPIPSNAVAVVAAPAPAQTAAKPAARPVAQRATPKPTPAPAATAVNGGVWDRLAQCESGGNWSINTGNGYYGGLQFSAASWKAVGGAGLPHQASKAEQIARAEKLQAIQGWGAWPACTAKLGIR